MQVRSIARRKMSSGRATVGTEGDRALAEWNSRFLGTIDPTRERRREAILCALGTPARPPVRVLDLGTGPGPLAERILRQFPGSQVVGVDFDPVRLRVAEVAMAPNGSRVDWVRADIRREDWSAELPTGRFDAVVSSLALHWLEKGELRRLFRDLHQLLRPGGLLVNGDFLPSERTEPARRPRKSAEVGKRPAENNGAKLSDFKQRWKRWWEALVRQRDMVPYFEARQNHMPGAIPPRRTSGPRAPASVEFHLRALRAARFRDTAVAWRENGFPVLVGTNGASSASQAER